MGQCRQDLSFKLESGGSLVIHHGLELIENQAQQRLQVLVQGHMAGDFKQCGQLLCPLLQRLLRPLTLGDVQRILDELYDLALIVKNGMAVHFKDPGVAIPVVMGVFHYYRFPGFLDLFQWAEVSRVSTGCRPPMGEAIASDCSR